VFKEKYVLLFISSLNKVEDEILLLNSIYDRLKDNPQEMIKGYKKEDFKILWIPIFDGDQKIKFDSLKNKIKFYAVEYFSELPGIGLIRDNLNYWDKPIVPVLSPLGEIMNYDAMDLIFQWGIDAFPFRKKDGYDLTQKWKWFWDVTKRVNLGIQVNQYLSALYTYTNLSFISTDLRCVRTTTSVQKNKVMQNKNNEYIMFDNEVLLWF
jgi:hypothetical protein